jgi:hypothetical protein
MSSRALFQSVQSRWVPYLPSAHFVGRIQAVVNPLSGPSMRHQNMAAQLDLAVRRGQLISKDLAVKQASFLMISLRQRLLNLSSHTHKLVGLDADAMRKALREIAISTLNEIKNLPSAVSDPNWLRKLEADDGK